MRADPCKNQAGSLCFVEADSSCFESGVADSFSKSVHFKAMDFSPDAFLVKIFEQRQFHAEFLSFSREPSDRSLSSREARAQRTDAQAVSRLSQKEDHNSLLSTF